MIKAHNAVVEITCNSAIKYFSETALLGGTRGIK